MNNQCLIKIGDRKYISDNPYIAVSDELIKWCKNKNIYDDVIVRLKIGDKYKNIYAQYIPEDNCFEFLQVWWGGESEVEIVGCRTLQESISQTIFLPLDETDKRRKEIERLFDDHLCDFLYTDNKELIFTDIINADLTVGDCVEFSGEISENGIHNAILLEEYEDMTGTVFKFVTSSDRPCILPARNCYKINEGKAEYIITGDVDHMTYGQIIEIHLNDINKGHIFIRKLK